MKKIQVTIVDKSNKYKPMSTIIEVENFEVFNADKKKYLKSAIAKICCQRNSSYKELTKGMDVDIKIREYDLEKIQAQKEQMKKQAIINKMLEKAREQKLHNSVTEK